MEITLEGHVSEMPLTPKVLSVFQQYSLKDKRVFLVASQSQQSLIAHRISSEKAHLILEGTNKKYEGPLALRTEIIGREGMMKTYNYYIAVNSESSISSHPKGKVKISY